MTASPEAKSSTRSSPDPRRPDKPAKRRLRYARVVEQYFGVEEDEEDQQRSGGGAALWPFRGRGGLNNIFRLSERKQRRTPFHVPASEPPSLPPSPRDIHRSAPPMKPDSPLRESVASPVARRVISGGTAPGISLPRCPGLELRGVILDVSTPEENPGGVLAAASQPYPIYSGRSLPAESLHETLRFCAFFRSGEAIGALPAAGPFGAGSRGESVLMEWPQALQLTINQTDAEIP